jgi:hypothetical protein
MTACAAQNGSRIICARLDGEERGTVQYAMHSLPAPQLGATFNVNTSGLGHKGRGAMSSCLAGA